MKSRKSREVPLTDQVLAVLDKAEPLNIDERLIFPSGIIRSPLFNNTSRQALQKCVGVDSTVHGMRLTLKE